MLTDYPPFLKRSQDISKINSVPEGAEPWRAVAAWDAAQQPAVLGLRDKNKNLRQTLVPFIGKLRNKYISRTNPKKEVYPDQQTPAPKLPLPPAFTEPPRRSRRAERSCASTRRPAQPHHPPNRFTSWSSQRALLNATGRYM